MTLLRTLRMNDRHGRRNSAPRGEGGDKFHSSRREHGHKVYELGSRDPSGREKAVHVAANGKILKVERATG